MPQLDIYNIFSQVFWASFFFVSFYFLIAFVVVPTIFSMLFSRTFLNSHNKEYYEISFSVIFINESVIFDSFFEPTIRSLNDTLSNSVDFYTSCESAVTEKNIIFF
jgi:Plant ATP synthase F0